MEGRSRYLSTEENAVISLIHEGHYFQAEIGTSDFAEASRTAVVSFEGASTDDFRWLPDGGWFTQLESLRMQARNCETAVLMNEEEVKLRLFGAVRGERLCG
jgi:hypothetical protein